jgi:hypothetical protein
MGELTLPVHFNTTQKGKSSNGSVKSLSDGAGTGSGGAATALFLPPRRITEVTLKVNQACS